MKVELTRVKIQKDKSSIVDEWMEFLNKNLPSVLETLKGEKMFVETIFREVWNGDEYLYWYSVQGEGGVEVENSDHWIDKKHLEYWEACVDENFIPFDLKAEVVMIPENISKEMK